MVVYAGELDAAGKGAAQKLYSMMPDKFYYVPMSKWKDANAGEHGESRRIGVIDLPSFYGEGAFGEGNLSTSRDVEELINKLKDEQIDGLVLDLRNNGGGRLDEAVKLTGLFISKGPVVMKRSYDGEIQEDWDRNQHVAWD